jgi:DNA-binding transcriptional ArsR family regulator
MSAVMVGGVKIVMKSHELNLDRIEGEITLQQLHNKLPGEAELVRMARIFQALSDPTRCKLILALIRRELFVGELATLAGISISAVSHHLKGLKDIQLVHTRRDGNTIYYSIDDTHVGNLFREVLSHLEHVDTVLAGKSN